MINQKILFGDAQNLIKKLDDGSINLIVTSPPYNISKKYWIYKDDVSLEEWKCLISNIFKEAKRILAKNWSFFLNISPVPDKKTKEIIPLDAICYFIGKEHWFYLRNSIIWQFNNMQNPVKRLSWRRESILRFVKDINDYVFNLDDIRIPYITQNDKRLVWWSGRNPTDVRYFDRVNNMTKKKLWIDAPCVYPVPMIERILKMSSMPWDTILDPFLWSGTTLVACKRLGRNWIWFEIDENYKSLIEKRLKMESDQLLNI